MTEGIRVIFDGCQSSKDDPKWDLTKLKRSIPDHFYVSNTNTSIYYALRSYFFVAVLGITNYMLMSTLSNPLLKIVVTLLYWFAQGTVFWGIFTIGHDCGHRSFSKYQWVNDLFGIIWHGSILVPYYAWKVSHAHHHKNTGNIENDEIFYPIYEGEAEHLTAQAKAFISYCFFFGFGWIAYLIAGFPGINYSRNFGGNPSDGPCHFNPYSKMFRKGLFLGFCSVAFVAFMLILLTMFSLRYSFLIVAQYYLIPHFVFSTYLVLVTFLHHASEHSSWLTNSEWNYSRGQLMNSVDRDYGTVINNVSHNIGTHVIHHLFPIIPHYHLVEATKYLKKYTEENEIQFNESTESISGLGTFITEVQRYAKNFIVPDSAAIYSISKGKILQHKNETKLQNCLKINNDDEHFRGEVLVMERSKSE